MLLGAAVPAGTASLLDLGAGVGTAGLVALALNRAECAVLAERDELALELARANIADNGLAARARVVAADITAPGAGRRAAGLAENAHDCIIANPPYFAREQGTLAPEKGRAGARHMDGNGLDLWMRCAAGCARAGAQAIFIYPAEGLAALLAAMGSRFGELTVLPLSPRPDMAASRVLVRGRKGSRAPLTLLAGRALHGAAGHGFAAPFEAIFRGEAALDW